MGNIVNTRIGVCSVEFDDKDLGHTKGGVELSYEPTVADIGVDQYGTSPVDLALVGENLTIKLALAEATVENLSKGITAGEFETGTEGERLEIGANSGKMFAALAKELVLHPTRLDAADESEDVVIYKAVVTEAVVASYTIDEQRVFEVTFRALIDETKSVGNRLGHVGVPSIS